VHSKDVSSDIDLDNLLLDTFYVAGLHFPPFIIKSDNKGTDPTGIIAELTKEVLRKTGHRAVFKISNWARAIQVTQYGVTDALIPTMKSKDREKFLRYPTLPLLVLDFVLIQKSDNNIAYDGNISSLEKYKILKLRKGRVTPEFDKAFEDGKLDIQERADYGLLVKGIAAERADLAAISNFNFYDLVKKLKLEGKVKVVSPSLGQTPVYLALSKNSTTPELSQQTSKAITELIEDGTYASILKKYIGPHVDVQSITDQILSYAQ